jgi:hypothetical protein
MMTSVENGKTFDARRVARDFGATDLVLSLNPWHSTSVDMLLELLAPAQSIGFNGRFKTALPLDFSKHSADLAFDVPLRVNPALTIDGYAGPPRMPARAVRRARQLLTQVPSSMRVLTVHADSGLWAPDGAHVVDANIGPHQVRGSKMWPTNEFVHLLDTFLDRHADFIALVVGGVDLHLDRGRCGSRVIQCCGLPLDVSFAVVGGSDLFVGVDSCMLHAADLYRVPGVGLFGPTEPREFGFRFNTSVHVNGGPFMEHISVESVAEALDSLVARRPVRSGSEQSLVLP